MHERSCKEQSPRSRVPPRYDGAMTAERSTDERAPEVALEGRSRLLRVVLAVVIAVALVVLAAVLVGPQPKSADAGFPDRPPPLALPSDEPKDSLLARAAAQLAEGKLPAARLAFTDVVAGDQDGVAGQVGLVLSRWRSTGPESVERDLRQLTLEYP